jgi:putative oxidoreductase
MAALLTPPAALRNTGLLIGRVLLGVVLIAHGWQKFSEWTIAGTTQSFQGMGVPLAGVSAPVAAIVELVGGILMVLGLATPIVGALVAIQMLVAAVLVHVAQGVFVGANGWELVGMIGALALVLAVTGAGRYSLDQVIVGRRTAASSTSAGSAARTAEPAKASAGV